MFNYTFIIPHKNSPNLLKRCVDSIPQRDDVQIIIVDDNSLQGFKPSLQRDKLDIILLSEDEAKGAGHARNVGMSSAEGKWLLFADADDYYCEDLLLYLDRYKDSNYDVVYFNYGLIRQDSTIESYSLIENYKGSKNELDAIKYRTNAPWNKMVRKSYVEERHLHFEETVNGNDMFFTYQIGYFARNIQVDKSMVYYYDTTSNGMTNRKRNSEDYYLCRLNHWFQANAFFKFIGHAEWQSSIFIRLIAVLYKKGIGQFLLCLKVFLRNYSKIMDSKMKFVNEIIEK